MAKITAAQLAKDIKEMNVYLMDKTIDAEDRETLEETLEDMKVQLAELEAEEASAKKKDAKPAAKKAATKKAEPAKPAEPPAPKKTIRLFGKTIELDEDNCDLGSELRRAYETRKKTSDATKKRTVPITKKIAGKIADTVKAAIKNVEAADIKEAPKQYEAKFNKLIKSAEQFAEDFDAVLGDDFKDNQIASEFKEVKKLMTDLIAKYKK
jgi:hypothetical protein